MYAVLESGVERPPLKVKKVKAEELQFSTELRLATFTFDLTIQALKPPGVSADTAALPDPGEFQLSLLEVSQIYADHYVHHES